MMDILKIFRLRWHRRAGLAAALFLIILAVTGFLLNHARSFGLHTVYLDQDWILAFYNMDLPKDMPPEMAEQYRGSGITLEKILLDIHTGAIIGLPGRIVSDLAALAILFLSASGLYNWWRRRPPKRKA
ncbi:MAG: PepSY domain-containing protein [Alphaproteobacteria bacterium]|nr:PepSY domain-containing protein [Alphaproteobacteria bacterium]